MLLHTRSESTIVATPSLIALLIILLNFIYHEHSIEASQVEPASLQALHSFDQPNEKNINETRGGGVVTGGDAGGAANGDLDYAASDTAPMSSTSHRLVVSGWPSTSPMWPSIKTSTIDSSTSWPNMIGPFIYADKPRNTDYSFSLQLNETVIEMLKSFQVDKKLAVNISFEYYFDSEGPDITAPGIKIEVNRKQFEYLEPGDKISTRMWLKFNGKFFDGTQKFVNKDWLKVSLVNRQSPSLVAIRKLKVEFYEDKNGGGAHVVTPPAPAHQATTSGQPSATSKPPSTTPAKSTTSAVSSAKVVEEPQATVAPNPSSTASLDTSKASSLGEAEQSFSSQSDSDQVSEDLSSSSPARPEVPAQAEFTSTRSPAEQRPAREAENDHYGGSKSKPSKRKNEPYHHQEPEEESERKKFSEKEVEEALDSPIKPVTPAKSNFWSKIRKRRDTNGGASENGPMKQNSVANVTRITLTCFTSDACEWRPDSSETNIQWSLARQPPSTKTVQSGYYYVSNQNNYGDATKMLIISLNQTASATVVDQNLDHCVEMALYVTEMSYLKLYRLTKSHQEEVTQDGQIYDSDARGWTKGNLLFTWAPTLASTSAVGQQANSSDLEQDPATSWWRPALPKTQLAAMEGDQNGWSLETLCFGDFFPNSRECGAGNCAFGFEMEADASRSVQQILQRSGSPASDQSENGPELASGERSLSEPVEQVVGVALLREFALNIPVKSPKPKWLETWQREEVEPGDNWKFYPRSDYSIGANNLSFVNLYDDSHYFLASDWLDVDSNLDFAATLVVELMNGTGQIVNESLETLLFNITAEQASAMEETTHTAENNIFTLEVSTKLVDSDFSLISSQNSTIEWTLNSNGTRALYNLGLAVTEMIKAARGGQLKLAGGEKNSNDAPNDESSLFKIVLEFVLDCHWLSTNRLSTSTLSDGGPTNEPKDETIGQLMSSHDLSFKLSLANVSLSDRCYPSPCEFGQCQQNGTGYDDWNCQCDERHRGRRCEFGRWCNLAHVTPWTGGSQSASGSNGGGKSQQLVLKAPTHSATNGQSSGRQAKLAPLESVTRVSGKEYCQRKLGPGYKCTDLDLPLNDNLYTDEDKTFVCSCQDDFYLSDDSKCKQAHLCNSIVCPSIGMICDDSKPFNRSQPCQCNERQDWFSDPQDPANKCIRRQCHDVKRDCQFDAHVCLPTLPGEKPICKCGPKFNLKVDNKGRKYCQSSACVLPSLNDCQQICVPDNTNLKRPYTCSCHPGYALDSDGRTCKPQRPTLPPHCKPACDSDTQFCTDSGCKCKQGYVGEAEVRVTAQQSTNSTSGEEYVQSVSCLNICSLSYPLNKEEVYKIESVCPFGLCDPNTFECRCSVNDSSSVSPEKNKYEPIYANSSLAYSDAHQVQRQRISPLCHLKRICEPNSSSYKLCKSKGAMCIPDYAKPALFDCICPPPTEKKSFGQGTSGEFACEPKCSSKKYDCIRRQAVCKLMDKDQVECDCLPGLIFDQHDKKCYLAKYSYSLNLIVANIYYQPESKFHRIVNQTNVEGANLGSTKLFESNSQTNNGNKPNEEQLSEIIPQFNQLEKISKNQTIKSMFIPEYNQCNITQVIPKSVIEDPYEHDFESYLGYIDQCNEKIHQNVKTYNLNSKLSEDLRQALRQHIRDFTVTTNDSSCSEMESGMYLNCTIYLQSNEPIPEATVDYVFNECARNGQDEHYCWIKPRLLLKKIPAQPQKDEIVTDSNNGSQIIKRNQELNYRQIIPCEIDNFCGIDAVSVRNDNKTSLCSCKCPHDIEVIDVKELESRRHEDDPAKSVKEVCAPKNRCDTNSTFCSAKPGSACRYDISTGSRCDCVPPSYEDKDGRCIEVSLGYFNNTHIVIVVMLGICLVVSIALNFTALVKSKKLFRRSKQYPLSEFSPARSANRSTGIPNLGFVND